ncbi:MAG: hypothetical protein OEV59_00290 [Deltaproteobacteria bacterium]|nr:hypothetical protein [Deltaproteobacteria bacterium]
MPAVKDLSSLPPGKTIIFGKIELIPPLSKGAQRIKGSRLQAYENKAALLTSSSTLVKANEDYRYRLSLSSSANQFFMLKEPVYDRYDKMIEIMFGETFYVMAEDKPFYVVASEVYMNDARWFGRVFLPSGYKVDIKSGDEAVYVGTIRYYRNEFMDIVSVDVVDEYEAEKAAIMVKFGNKIRVRKALVSAKSK